MFNDLFGLFYPKVCAGCDSHLMDHEQNLCLKCIYGLPKTYFWDYDVTPVEELFRGRIKVSSACTFLHFETGNVVQRLMHRLKYEGKTAVGTELGIQFGHILKEKRWFSDVDVIVPIPLHSSRQLRRGYNQSSFIAAGLAEVFDVPVRQTALKRIIASDSQTKKSRFERSKNVENVFTPTQTNVFPGKNVLLVDDVITTGATLEAAGNAILQNGAKRLYIATLAIA